MVRHADWQCQFDHDLAVVEERSSHRSRVRGGVRPSVGKSKSSSVLALTGSMTTLSGSYPPPPAQGVFGDRRDSATMRRSVRHVSHRSDASIGGSLLHWSCHDGREFGQPKVIVGERRERGHRLRVRRVNDTILACAMLDRTNSRGPNQEVEIGDVGPPTVRNLGPLVAVRGCQNTHGLDLSLDASDLDTCPCSDLPMSTFGEISA